MAGLAACKPDESESSLSQPLTTSSDDPEDLFSPTYHPPLKNKSKDRVLEFQNENDENRKEKHGPSLKKKSQDQDLEFQSDESREEKHKARINMCCAWASLVIGTFILILLFLGTLLFSFFASNMPSFYLNGLTVNKLQFNKTRTDVFMTSKILLTLNATNTKEKIQFLYTNLRADIYSDDVFLGRVILSGFHQKANNSTELKLRPEVKSQPVAEADAWKMKSDLESNSLNIDLDLKGRIHYEIRGHRISGFPFRVSCHDKVQSAINQKQQSCSVKITPLT